MKGHFLGIKVVQLTSIHHSSSKAWRIGDTINQSAIAVNVLGIRPKFVTRPPIKTGGLFNVCDSRLANLTI